MSILFAFIKASRAGLAELGWAELGWAGLAGLGWRGGYLNALISPSVLSQ